MKCFKINNLGIVKQFYDLYEYKELLCLLTLRDIKVRYKQSILGIAWVVLKPIILMSIFIIFLKHNLYSNMNEMPYFVFLFIGMMSWTLFSQSLSSVTECVLSNVDLVRKTSFPRMILPLASIISSLFDFIIAILIIGFLAVIRFDLSFKFLLFVPIWIFLLFVLVLGFGLPICALNVKYRDFRHIVPFAIQVSLFITPIFYSLNVVSQKYLWIVFLNPLTGIVELGRAMAAENYSVNFNYLGISLSVLCIMLFLGSWIFYRLESSFADEI